MLCIHIHRNDKDIITKNEIMQKKIISQPNGLCYYFFPQFCTVHQHRLLLFHYCRRIFFLFFAKSHLYLFLWSKLLDFQTFIFPFVMCFFPAHSVFRVLSVVVSCKKGFHANLYRRPFEPTVYIYSGLVFNILINYFTARVTFFSFSFSLFHPC